jgi:hypothetical protein
VDRGLGAGDPLSLQAASNSNPKIGNITFTIIPVVSLLSEGLQSRFVNFASVDLNRQARPTGSALWRQRDKVGAKRND